ncbi:DUF5335 family protein [Nodosilinea nodulosa]|uniref:DUF5335 family protein n=1 Tax=Nodosilinea nodulosa TaxID=416001 RepID=UPI0002F77A75|nr:DUF5335 family protein [Nodosilinea nodulosa]
MDLPPSQTQYRLVVPPQVWREFFEQFTSDYRGRLITLKILDQQMGDFEVLSHKRLFSVLYEPPNHGNDLVVTVSRPLSVGTATYAHVIVYPQMIDVITDQGGKIESCTVTDDDHAQTIICLES